MSSMKAMILAAGYGERLWPLTADRTKPALPVLGKPLVGYTAEYLAGLWHHRGGGESASQAGFGATIVGRWQPVRRDPWNMFTSQ
jgi:hypothetical protein